MLKCANNFRKSNHKGNLTLIILCSFSFSHNIYELKYWLYNYRDSIHNCDSQCLTIVIALFSLSLRPTSIMVRIVHATFCMCVLIRKNGP